MDGPIFKMYDFYIRMRLTQSCMQLVESYHLYPFDNSVLL
jgi:hypothetical protein